MGTTYEIKGSTVDGEVRSQDLEKWHEKCELSSIIFYQGGAVVTPTAGNVTFSGTPDGQVWRKVTDGAFLAADAYSTERTPPYAEGLMVKAKLSLAGIVGADSFVATIWRA